MKKTVYINLNGFAFHIDEDAYEKLQQYLNKIEGSFSDKEEAKEIVADIEARIAELFSGKKKSAEEVISLKEVEEVIATMGEPQDIADEEEPGSQSENSSSSINTPIYSKRLYRDPDNRFLGGVCGGLGAYFDMDPIVFRIIFLIAFFLYGSSLPIYIVLWIVMPKASTITQRLEMKGPASYEKWEQNLRDEYQQVTEKFRQSKAYQNFSGSVSKSSDAVGDALRVMVRVLLVIIGVALMIGTLATLIPLVLTFTFGITFFDFFEVNNYITSLPAHFMSGTDLTIGTIGVVLLVCVPIISLFYLGFRMVFRFKGSKPFVGWMFAGLWIVAWVLVFYTAAKSAREFSAKSDTYKMEQLTLPQTDTLYLKANTSIHEPDYKEHMFDFNHLDVFMVDQRIYVEGNPRIELVRGDDFKIEIKKSAKGRSIENAEENCDDIEFFWMQRDSVLTIDPIFTLNEDSKIRDQRVKAVITVPENLNVKVDDELEWKVYSSLD